MSDLITTGASGYALGDIDSATVLVSNVSPVSAKHPNGLAAATVQIETILGSGTTLKGTKVDLATRLATAHDPGGKLNLTDVNALNGPLLVSKGGSGQSTAPDQRYLIGNGTTFDLFTPHGFIYSGPTSTGTGSTAAHGGVVTLSVDQVLSGLNIYTDFTLSTGTILTVPTGSHRVIILASNSITINGTINTSGGGAAGGAGGGSGAGNPGSAGAVGFSQPGGGGGGATADLGGAGGTVQVHGVTIQNGGTAGGVAANGSGGVTQTGVDLVIADPLSIMGGSGGGGGGSVAGTGGGTGGRGGGSIILIAPSITLGSASVLKTSGSNGGATAGNAGGGGGGGAGNVYIFTRLFTNNGTTFTQVGGTGNASSTYHGGNGAAGTKQIMVYANN